MLTDCVDIYISIVSPFRETVGNLIQRFFNQLSQGCGDKACTNKYCATGSGHPMEPTDAATKALLFATSHSKCEAKLCPDSSTMKKNTVTNLPAIDGVSTFLEKLTCYYSPKKISLSILDKRPPAGQLTRYIYAEFM